MPWVLVRLCLCPVSFYILDYAHGASAGALSTHVGGLC